MTVLESVEAVEDIYRLWDELSDLGALAGEAGVRHCMQRISDWIGADHAFWIGAIRMEEDAKSVQDSVHGWRIAAVEMLHANAGIDHRAYAGVKDSGSGDPSMSTHAITTLAGQFRVHNLYSMHECGLLDLDAFEKTQHYDYFYRQPGISDRIWAVFPINEDAESYFCFDSCQSSRRFSAGDLDLVARTLRGIKWFHCQLMLSHGLCVSNAQLTRSERQVLHGLLAGASEKEIAAELHRTQGTINQYAVKLYRKFGVRSRAELMSLWLSGCPASMNKGQITSNH